MVWPHSVVNYVIDIAILRPTVRQFLHLLPPSCYFCVGLSFLLFLTVSANSHLYFEHRINYSTNVECLDMVEYRLVSECISQYIKNTSRGRVVFSV